jgi:protein-disulfide isomerase
MKPVFDEQRDNYWGDPMAPVEVIQYGDFQCPNCADVYPVIKLLQEKMGARMKFVFRHYPQPAMHPVSLYAAVAAEAAAVQDKFWHMHDIIFENQKYLSRGSLGHFAEEIELNTQAFDDSREHKKLFHKVISDFETGLKCGVDGTPTFFIDGRRYNGFHDLESLYKTCRFVWTCKTLSPELQDTLRV